MNLQVPIGAFHHLKGPSGSGKSTFLRLLAGLYSPDSGRIGIGSLDIAAAAPYMAFLPQFPHLYSGSILENLKIFSGEATQDHLVAVARDTGLDAWVSTLPMGYQTIAASGGENFSGGQRQLVSLSGTLASNRQILLLDEAMSNLDWVSRNQILKCPQFLNRTVIYASHEEILIHTG
jgi:ABC-type bacteriocin/lantibiotic exporter with double-glycine peptidase domain